MTQLGRRDIIPICMPDSQNQAPDDPNPADRWDAHDPRREHDQMAPPAQPCECYCLHCGRVFMSDQIWLQRVVGGEPGFEGFWMCPTPNCGGAGFTFDIFPTDPDHPANEGWHSSDDGDYGEDAFDEHGNYIEPEDRVYDPAEPNYPPSESAELAGIDDIEGEEWKYGLSPGESPPEPQWMEEARKQQEEEDRKYNEPDQRPREIEWSDRIDPMRGSSEDDIPY